MKKEEIEKADIKELKISSKNNKLDGICTFELLIGGSSTINEMRLYTC
jgi:hypothetical protein